MANSWLFRAPAEAQRRLAEVQQPSRTVVVGDGTGINWANSPSYWSARHGNTRNGGLDADANMLLADTSVTQQDTSELYLEEGFGPDEDTRSVKRLLFFEQDIFR